MFNIKKSSVIFQAMAVVLVMILLNIGLETNAAENEHTEMRKKDHNEEGTMKGAHGHTAVPHEYEGKINPYWTDLKNIMAGSSIYNTNCIVCHGKDGKGDGTLGKTLSPKPANFTESKMMAETKDEYLFWRVSEGGQFLPFKSAMPPFKNALDENEIWQVLSYVHAFSHVTLLQHTFGEEPLHIED